MEKPLFSVSNPSWLYPKTAQEAIDAQKEMASYVVASDCIDSLQYIAGIDVSSNPRSPEDIIFGSAVVLSFPDFQIIEEASSSAQARFPYIPGLLGFREAPVLVETINRLTIKPDLLMVDGHGMSHPRLLGIASHIGVLLDIPTIGVAKSILVGKPCSPIGEDAGQTTPLIWKGNTIGIMLRSKKRTSPLIISVGHKVSLNRAVQIVIQSLRKHKLPEPTRYAHLYANKARKESSSS